MRLGRAVAAVLGLVLFTGLITGCSAEEEQASSVVCADLGLDGRGRQVERPTNCEVASPNEAGLLEDGHKHADSDSKNGGTLGQIKDLELARPKPTSKPTPAVPDVPSQTPTKTSSPTPTPTPTPTPPEMRAPDKSLKVGDTSPYSSGSYVLWIKEENALYLVENGVVWQAFTATGNVEKTPVGDYKVKYKLAASSSVYDSGWRLKYFIGFYRRPGATGDIGIHAIPDKNGTLLQDPATLGHPDQTTGGCLRLYEADAKVVYDFVSTGTPVLVR